MATDEYFTQPVRPRVVWYGLFAGPLAWTIHLMAAYALVPWVCDNGHGWILYLISFLSLSIAATGGLAAWQNFKQSGRRWPGEEGDVGTRSLFMATMGIILGSLFSVVIIAQSIPIFMMNPCL